MTELTLEEKLAAGEHRAREEIAEKHFFDKAQPFFPLGFSVSYRGPGHWDVWAQECPGRISAMLAASPGSFTSSKDGGNTRAFRIRGEPGDVYVIDERWNPYNPHPRDTLRFRSVMGAMLWIAEELMQEPTP